MLSSCNWGKSGLDKRLCQDMTLWSWGANSYGQLGQGDCEDQLVPSKHAVSAGYQVHHIGGGGGHTLMVTDHGQLYTCGSNNKGQLGLGNTEDQASLQQVKAFKSKVTMATGGWDFSIAVTECGAMYCWGSNSFGQLGDPNLPAKCSSPARVYVDNGRCVVQAAAGLRHAVALTDDGCVYCWGHAKKGQCGTIGDEKPGLKYATPTKVTLPRDIDRVVYVAAGSYHTVALTDSGVVVTWGCNKYGQCALDPQGGPQVNHPTVIGRDLFGGEKVTAVRSGWTHLIAQTESRSLFSWGRGNYGQLGWPLSLDQPFSHIPARVDTSQTMISFECGSEHTLFITDDHQLCALGWNEHGLCGTGDEVNVTRITNIPSLQGCHTVQIGCGGGHCFAITHQKLENG